MDPGDLAEIYAAIRSAQLNADFVIAAIHSHECSIGCDDDDAPRGAANFLKELARGAIDSGADMFVATGNHNLGPIEIYDSPARGKRPIFYGLGNFFWSDVQELLPADLFARNRELLGDGVAGPAEGNRVRPDGAAQHAVLRARVHVPERYCGGPIPGQPVVGNRAAPGGARLRRPADDERDSATGQRTNRRRGKSSTRS